MWDHLTYFIAGLWVCQVDIGYMYSECLGIELLNTSTKCSDTSTKCSSRRQKHAGHVPRGPGSDILAPAIVKIWPLSTSNTLVQGPRTKRSGQRPYLKMIQPLKSQACSSSPARCPVSSMGPTGVNSGHHTDQVICFWSLKSKDNTRYSLNWPLLVPGQLKFICPLTIP